MVPITTTNHAMASSAVPTPSPTLDTGPKKTSVGNTPEITSILVPGASQGSKTIVLESVTESGPKLGGIVLGTSSNTEQQRSAVSDPGKAPPSSARANADTPDAINSYKFMEPVWSTQTSRNEVTLVSSPQRQPAISPLLEDASQKSDSPPENPQAQSGTAPSHRSPEQLYQTPQGSDSQSLGNQMASDQPQPSDVYVSAAGSSLIVGLSSLPPESSINQADENGAKTAPSQSHTVGNGRQTIHLSAPADISTATIASQAIAAISNGALFHGTIITPGAAPLIVQGTSLSLDSSSLIHLGSMPDQLPIPSLVPTLTLANSVVAVPVQSGVSISGTTLTPGAAAFTVSGIAISLGTSGDLILATSVLNEPQSIVSLPSSPSNSEDGILTDNGSSQVMFTASTAAKAAQTLSPGAPAVTVNGMAVSAGSTGGIVVSSKTFVLESPNGGLGNVIMGGLQSGGPYPADFATNVHLSSTAAPSIGPSTAMTSTSRAKSLKGLLSRRLVTTLVAGSAICLQL